MFDFRFLAFVGVATLLVLSPGATMAVVTTAAIEDGRRAALLTVAGVGCANATLVLVFAFGLSLAVGGAAWTLEAITVGGAVYLGYLGLRSLWRVVRAEYQRGPAGNGAASVERAASRGGWAHVGRGLATNLLNPSVVLFYATVVPQFIGRSDVFLQRFLLLGCAHVLLSVVWQGAVGISVGMLSDRLARPRVRRILETIMGVVLLAFALRLIVR
jgi:threonine/homoserine/homoserine lactone efflux protein